MTNPAAHARAAYYAQRLGSARAALDAVNQPGHNDAFERAVVQELETMAHAEAVAANATDGRTWGERFLAQQAIQKARDAEREAEHRAYLAKTALFVNFGAAT